MSTSQVESKLIDLINTTVKPISLSDSQSLSCILRSIGDSRIVLLGEASHGTYEFYQARIELSKRLIVEKEFQAIAIEGDWTSIYPMHQYVNHHLAKLKDAFKQLHRFPTWMWSNETMPPFLKWLREYNSQHPNKIGFFGLDLYSLYAAMRSVIDYLGIHDPQAAARAEKRYACFDHAAQDPQMYGYLTDIKVKDNCIKEVTEQFLEMNRIAFEKLQAKDKKHDDLFSALQNARLVKNAEHYYRAMFEDRDQTWNIRDQHMAETLQNLISHLETKTEKPAKIIIWAHNSHIGDARVTEMSQRKEINLGQLVREQYAATTYHLGFSTYQGDVTAADGWDEPAQTKIINPGMLGSYEDMFHHAKEKNFFLDLHQNPELNKLLELSRLQRAIGVVYRPETERSSHYYFTRLPLQFDGIVHFDKTRAIKPL